MKTLLLYRLAMLVRLLSRLPIVFLIAMYIAIVYSCLYLLFMTVTEVFQKTYKWRIEISGLSYVGLNQDS